MKVKRETLDRYSAALMADEEIRKQEEEIGEVDINKSEIRLDYNGLTLRLKYSNSYDIDTFKDKLGYKRYNYNSFISNSTKEQILNLIMHDLREGHRELLKNRKKEFKNEILEDED